MTGILDGITIDNTRARTDEAGRKVSTDKLAVTTVRKITMPHNRRCRGYCSHRNHRRDHARQELYRDILGLPDEPATPSDYASQLEWASMSRSDAAVMSGKSYSNGG